MQTLSGITTHYSQKNDSGQYVGVYFEKEFAENFLSTKVSSKFYDVEGEQILSNMFADIIGTGFDNTMLSNVLSTNPYPYDWRLGECIAECYLEDNHNIHFHYNVSRDAKNLDASPTGADLVGFTKLSNDTVFLFGEVKTSTSTHYPPTVMTGRFGMICQLENIHADIEIQGELIRWVAHKVSNLENTDQFKKDFDAALTSYYDSQKKKFVLTGVLIRDVDPNENDLKNRYTSFVKLTQGGTYLILSAIYLPIKIDKLSEFLKKPGT